MNLSVAIISFNEEQNIGRTIKAVQPVASEIIVVDSFSTDRTCEIAKGLGAKVYNEPWKGHIAQKNSALDKCSEEWILCVDADEVLTEEAASSIRQVIEGNTDIAGYMINRRTFYMGKLLKYSWQPDWKLRLVKRSRNPRWGGYDPHDVLMVDGKKRVLRGDLIHYSFKNFADHMQRTIQHAQVAAKSYHEKGKTCSVADLLLKPCGAFFKKFILQKSVLDGMPGVIASISGAVYVYMKYSFLWELRKKSK